MPAPVSLDPQIAAVLDSIPSGLPAIDRDNLPALREQRLVRLESLPPSTEVAREDRRVPGPPEAPDVVVRLHVPVGLAEPAPCLFFIHGGGYVMGSRTADDARFDRWCPTLGCIGVSVEYRLAPEVPFPGPLEDCYHGLRWVFEHARDLGIDSSRIGVGGASAGGGLAAALALLARDRGELPIAFQMLAYPMLDDRRTTKSSGWDVPVWSPANNEFGWRSYLGDLYGTDRVPYLAAAARAHDLTGLPPAFVFVGSVDGFCDEDVQYAVSLSHAGVPTELHVYPGAPHAFDSLAPDTALARRCLRNTEEWLAAVLEKKAD